MFHVKHLSQCSAISEQMFHVKHSAVRRRSGCRRRKDASVEGGEKVGRASLARRVWATAHGGWATACARGARAVNTAVGLARGGCGQRRARGMRADHQRGPGFARGGMAVGRSCGRRVAAQGDEGERMSLPALCVIGVSGPPSASSGTPPFASQQACRRRARRERSGCRAAKRTGRRVRPP